LHQPPPRLCGLTGQNIRRLNRSKLHGRVELRFCDAKLKRHGRFTSDLVGLWRRSGPSGATIFSRTRAPVRPLCDAEVRRDIAERPHRYLPRTLSYSARAGDIDAQLRTLRDDCTFNVPDEFRAHTTRRSNSPAFRPAPKLALHYT